MSRFHGWCRAPRLRIASTHGTRPRIALLPRAGIASRRGRVGTSVHRQARGHPFREADDGHLPVPPPGDAAAASAPTVAGREAPARHAARPRRQRRLGPGDNGNRPGGRGYVPDARGGPPPHRQSSHRTDAAAGADRGLRQRRRSGDASWMLAGPGGARLPSGSRCRETGIDQGIETALKPKENVNANSPAARQRPMLRTAARLFPQGCVESRARPRAGSRQFRPSGGLRRRG